MLVASFAQAVELAPGQRIASDDPFDHDPTVVNLQGQTLASRTTPFERRVFSEEAGRELYFRGTLRQDVIRESESGYLSFHYRLSAGEHNWNPGAFDIEHKQVSGFGPWFTEVRADRFGRAYPAFGRSADGDVISISVDDGFGEWLVVRTNAPAFGDGGTFQVGVSFQPTLDEASARIATFRPVPEATVAGAVVISAAVILWRRRRVAAVVLPLVAVR